jgi:hypothetical protein
VNQVNCSANNQEVTLFMSCPSCLWVCGWDSSNSRCVGGSYPLEGSDGGGSVLCSVLCKHIPLPTWTPFTLRACMQLAAGFMLPNPDEAVIWRGPRWVGSHGWALGPSLTACHKAAGSIIHGLPTLPSLEIFTWMSLEAPAHDALLNASFCHTVHVVHGACHQQRLQATEFS